MNTIFVFLSTLVLGVNCIVVHLDDGDINGTTVRTKEGRLFYKFLGIPYAKPPINESRFQPPGPVERWSGIRDATKPPPVCVQPSFKSNKEQNIGQEDCLYLNVYVPADLYRSGQEFPVIIGIHGGAFQIGSANDYAADYFMERDVIFVAINYRLGVLGFLAVNNITWINNDAMSGNYGLKDQSQAIRWVYRNIERFNGDSDNVALMGESAGSVSVHFHMFSPLSQGLFHRAIMQSGTAFSPWAHYATDYKEAIQISNITLQARLDQIAALKFLNKTNCLFVENNLECLQKIPEAQFIKGNLLQVAKFVPIIESNVTETLAFLPEKPDATNYQTLVPWLAGINSGEGTYFVPGLLINGSYQAKLMNSDKTNSIPHINQYDYTAKPEDMPTITNAILDFYFGSEDIGLETAHHAVDMVTDSLWLYPLKKTVASGPDKQYLYLYDHRGSFSTADRLNLTIDLGVCHGDEMPLLFRKKKQEAKRTIQDRRVSDTLLKYWINFAISGDPNQNSKEKLWQPVQNQNETFEYLHIKSDGVVMESNLFKERYELWKSLPTGWD